MKYRTKVMIPALSEEENRLLNEMVMAKPRQKKPKDTQDTPTETKEADEAKVS